MTQPPGAPASAEWAREGLVGNACEALAPCPASARWWWPSLQVAAGPGCHLGGPGPLPHKGLLSGSGAPGRIRGQCLPSQRPRVTFALCLCPQESRGHPAVVSGSLVTRLARVSGLLSRGPLCLSATGVTTHRLRRALPPRGPVWAGSGRRVPGLCPQPGRLGLSVCGFSPPAPRSP